MERIREYFQRNDHFGAHNGIELLEVKEGYARARMVVAPYHLNGVGIVHGAAIFTLGDLAFAAASNSHGNIAVGINVSISYLKAATSGVLWAEAREDTAGSRLGQYTIRITDEAGKLVALFNGMVYRKNEPLISETSS